MSIVKMSLYQALEKKKILEDRVNREMKAYRLCCVRKENDEVTKDGQPLDEVYKNSIQPGYQKSIALLKNLIALKAAINEANAKVTVEIDGKSYTIANAMVILRNHDKLADMYRRMTTNYQQVSDEVAKLNERSQSNDAINSYLEKSLGDGKRDPEMVKQLTNDYIARNTYSVYDPLDTMKVAQEALEHLEKFSNEIHYKLTQANVSTEIEVEFDD